MVISMPRQNRPARTLRISDRFAAILHFSECIFIPPTHFGPVRNAFEARHSPRLAGFCERRVREARGSAQLACGELFVVGSDKGYNFSAIAKSQAWDACDFCVMAGGRRDSKAGSATALRRGRGISQQGNIRDRYVPASSQDTSLRS
jgi:hypothetical protein